jgi:hypothetical protein
MLKKCYGEPNRQYPGLRIAAEVDQNVPGCVVTTHPSQQIISVVNYSLLTYEIGFRSSCDKDHLIYLGVPAIGDDRGVWAGSFTAPMRWDGEPRRTTADTPLSAKPGSAAQRDQEIAITITCKAASLAIVGPLGILLQVDTDGR